MPTAILSTGWEHGIRPVTSGGGLCSGTYGTGGTEYEIDATNQRTGSYCLKLAPTATTRAGLAYTIASTAKIVLRMYVKITSAPSAGTNRDLAYLSIVASNYPLITIDNTKFYIGYSGTYGKTEVAGPAFTIGQYHRIDWYVDMSANPWTVKLSIDGTEITHAPALAADASTSFRLGSYTTSGGAYTLYLDDMFVGATLADYPIGEGAVGVMVPVSDGTHNAGTNVVEDQAGNDIGAVSAYPLINEIPMSDTADYIRQAATGTANYAEVNLGTIASSIGTINSVAGLLAYQAASTSANNGNTYLYSGGTLVSTVFSGDMSESSMFYKYAAGTTSGAFGTAALAAIKGRVGYSSDASPNPYWCGLIVEYDYTTSSAPSIGTVTPAEASQSQTVDAAPAYASYLVAPAENSQSQTSDAASVSLATFISGAESTQAQASDAASLSVIWRIAPAENTNSQNSDAATLTGSGAIAPAENTNSQASDAATLRALYAITAAENSQGQTSDAAALSSGVTFNVSPAESTQAQAGDAAAVAFTMATYAITAAENTQPQTSDSAVITSGSPAYSITPTEASQGQASDSATARAVYVIGAAESANAQTSDSANVWAITGLTVAEASQGQVADPTSIIIWALLMRGNRRGYYPAARGMSSTSPRGSGYGAAREANTTGTRTTYRVNRRDTAQEDDE